MTKLETATVAAAMLLSGCAAPLPAPDARGVSFPARETSYRDKGIVVLPETMRQVQPGLDKDQVRKILGNPHFAEGLFFVKDWNYLIELTVPGAEKLDCQLQLRFDNASKVTATHWNTTPCAIAATVLGPEVASTSLPQTTATADVAAPGESLSLHGLLFPFARSDLEDLPAGDLARLEDFAAGVGARAHLVQEITIYGHSDRVGSPERRQQRSLARAHAVAGVFIRRGIDPQRITIIARNSAESVTDCPEQLPYTHLLGCLAPDRRVTVAVRTIRD